jgi:CRISPR-associated endonuclease/helicase Cas3
MEFRSFFEGATAKSPFPFQEAFATNELLPHVLAVPTGVGKTATVVLGWLWRRLHAPKKIRRETGRRLVFCLPMRSLVDQTAESCKDWLDKSKLTDKVGLSVLMGGSIARDWDDKPDSNQILIGTQDQLLSRALNRGYSMSRFRWPVNFAWLNNDCLWAVDEIQLMGSGLSTTAQLHALRTKLGTHGPNHTVWISATVPPGSLETVDLREVLHPERNPLRIHELQKADRARKELKGRLGAAKSLDRFDGDFDPKQAGKTAKKLIALHQPGSLSLIVVNRVARAQALVEALRKQAGDSIPVALVHSRFRPGDRKSVQAEVLSTKRRWTGILVATQAVEAGVDISARLLVTELASWPSLVQRFGRCNRYGEVEDACVLWVEPPNSRKEEGARPYTVDELEIARKRLLELDDVGPQSLASIELDRVLPALPVLRRADLLSLFDTQSDLAGHDIDISGYVRSTEADVDVQVYWRTWEGTAPPASMDAPHPDELCRVSVHELRKFLEKQQVGWRWSSLEAKWQAMPWRDLFPGLTILLPTGAGGYSKALGWTGNPNHVPQVIERPGESVPPDQDAGDPWTFVGGGYVELELHSDDVVEAVEALREEFGKGEIPWDTLIRAARWHDLGKAHAAFQTMLMANLPDDDERRGTIWAKSDRRYSGRCERPHFRHELASALALLEHGGSDLEVFLVAAHHGKVRLAIRPRPTEPLPKDRPDLLYALGVHDGDVLPEARLGGGVTVPSVTLHLAPMLLGRHDEHPSWSERCLNLLAEHGPFRLAYLESLVRVADWRGTRKRESEGRRHG